MASKFASLKVGARLRVVLPVDRVQFGECLLYSAKGEVIFRAPCLGRSAGLFDRVTGKVRHDRLATLGDTPTGLYALTFVSHLAKPVSGIGQLWIGLDPVGGEALQAERAGRRGLGIHGGRGDVLKPTHGCVRLRDSDMAELARVAAGMRFDVYVEDAA